MWPPWPRTSPRRAGLQVGIGFSRGRVAMTMTSRIVSIRRSDRRRSSVPKFVYDFNEGNRDLKDLLGGKGANLAEMTNLGLPVPPGFTITTEACKVYLDEGNEPPELTSEVSEHLERLEQAMGKRLVQPD